MGPRSDNRGYGAGRIDKKARLKVASMGPRSDNRGYGAVAVPVLGPLRSFNGSTVR